MKLYKYIILNLNSEKSCALSELLSLPANQPVCSASGTWQSHRGSAALVRGRCARWSSLGAVHAPAATGLAAQPATAQASGASGPQSRAT